MMFKFQEKTALVTGASGGIGRAIASMLIQQKCGVVLSAQRKMC